MLTDGKWLAEQLSRNITHRRVVAALCSARGPKTRCIKINVPWRYIGYLELYAIYYYTLTTTTTTTRRNADRSCARARGEPLFFSKTDTPDMRNALATRKAPRSMCLCVRW